MICHRPVRQTPFGCTRRRKPFRSGPQRRSAAESTARGGLAKGVGWTTRQGAVEQAAQRNRVDRQRRFPGRPPCSLVGIGKQRFAHVGEARTGVGAVFIGGGFYPKRTRSHGGALTSGTSCSPCRWRRRIISDRVTARKPLSLRSFTNDEESPFVSFGGHIG